MTNISENANKDHQHSAIVCIEFHETRPREPGTGYEIITLDWTEKLGGNGLFRILRGDVFSFFSLP